MAELRAPLPPPLPSPTPPRAGQLTSGWRLIMVVTWVGVVLGWSAVWNASVQLGQSTWWLGTRADPTPHVVRLAPFIGPIAVLLGALNNARWLAWVGVAGALVFGGYAIGDLGHPADLGAVELAVASAGLVVSLLALTGTYRRPRPR